MAMATPDLRSLVHQHCLFFDKLVEMIPPNYYIVKEDREDTWHYGMSKAAKTAAKKATKENLKKARRNKLDPDKFQSTLKLLQQKDKEGNEEAEEGTTNPTPPGHEFLEKTSRATNYEELRERLHKRIEMLRAKRHADDAAKLAKNAKSWQNEKKIESQKMKRKTKSVKDPVPNQAMPPLKRQKHSARNDESAMEKEHPSETTANFEFGRVKLVSQKDTLMERPKKQKESKERLLAKAMELQKEMQNPEKGQEIYAKHSWDAAVRRAAGEKVFDDPKLLKRSMKKEEQVRKRSSKKWKERKETVKKMTASRQQTRTEHIHEHIQEKKDRRIAKREKKLLRPGFEGRKEGFINS